MTDRIISAGKTEFSYPCTSNSECYPLNLTLKPGLYQIDIWGAGTTDLKMAGSYGGHSSGTISVSKSIKLYLYLGGKGIRIENGISPGGYNGGGNGGKGIYVETWGAVSGGSGGGATDLRLKYGKWNENLNSRILVAGGGGGSAWTGIRPGNGGGIQGEDSKNALCGTGVMTAISKGATQTTGFAFGKGEDATPELTVAYNCGAQGKGGGGGGYYGGFSNQPEGSEQNAAGGGGSGYFNSAYIINGSTGFSQNEGNGRAIITYIPYISGKFTEKKKRKTRRNGLLTFCYIATIRF